MRISDWSSDVCSSDLRTGSENVSSSQSLSTPPPKGQREDFRSGGRSLIIPCASRKLFNAFGDMAFLDHQRRQDAHDIVAARHGEQPMLVSQMRDKGTAVRFQSDTQHQTPAAHTFEQCVMVRDKLLQRSEEHTSDLTSLLR